MSFQFLTGGWLTQVDSCPPLNLKILATPLLSSVRDNIHTDSLALFAHNIGILRVTSVFYAPMMASRRSLTCDMTGVAHQWLSGKKFPLRQEVHICTSTLVKGYQMSHKLWNSAS